jgi:hypothetical protein
VTDNHPKSIPQWRKIVAAGLLVVLAAPFLPGSTLVATTDTHLLSKGNHAQCPVQPKALPPAISFDWDEAYKIESAKRLSRAVVSSSFTDVKPYLTRRMLMRVLANPDGIV